MPSTPAITEFHNQYRFLSNFYSSPVQYEGHEYRTVEHAFQAAKTLNAKERQAIARCPMPYEAKRKGQTVKLRADWEIIKLAVMEELLREKFRDAELRAKLLATGDAELIEGNHHGDRFYGVCNGAGENHLGLLLAKIRRDLRTGLTI